MSPADVVEVGISAWILEILSGPTQKTSRLRRSKSMRTERLCPWTNKYLFYTAVSKAMLLFLDNAQRFTKSK